jgi:hypothetical protein
MTDESKREAPISYRPPAHLRAQFRARVEKSGLSVNAYITKAIFDAVPPRQSRRPALAQQDLARLLAETAALRERLDALAPDGGPEAALHEEAVRSLHDIRLLLMQAMGRAP